tara:strand:+ start:130 stop:333 length:204 start_codon:yes stop_codon:yes gene_type:complete
LTAGLLGVFVDEDASALFHFIPANQDLVPTPALANAKYLIHAHDKRIEIALGVDTSTLCYPCRYATK